jgi:PKD repeat protein
MQPSLPSGTGSAAQQGISATLLGVPVYGTAPLTVGFYVGVANARGPLVYQWHFGDGVVASLPAGAYIPHVYQHPGTYFCSLILTAAHGGSAALFTTITVQAVGPDFTPSQTR